MAKTRNLTDLDIQILDDIGEHEALDTSMVYERHHRERTLRAVQIQLQGLAEDGLLLGVQHTVSKVKVIKGRQRRVTLRQPTVWMLTPKGGDAVEANLGTRPVRVKHNEPTPMTLLHRMSVIRTRLALDKACVEAALAPPAWVYEADRRSSYAKNTAPNQRSRMYHSYQVDGRVVACRLDAACRILLPPSHSNSNAEMTAVIFGWEIDWSTEGRKQLRATKSLALELWLRNKSYLEYWPDTNHLPTKVRVAWVVPTPKRIGAITETTSNSDVLSTYRFLTQQDIETSNLVTDAVWRTSSGSKLPLYKPTS